MPEVLYYRSNGPASESSPVPICLVSMLEIGGTLWHIYSANQIKVNQNIILIKYIPMKS